MVARPHSLRYRALVVVAVVVFAPLGFIGIAVLGDRGVGARMLRNLDAASRETADLLATASPGETLDPVAERHNVRLRVLSPNGELAADYDHEAASGLWSWLGDFFFGPEGPPTLRVYDQGLGPLSERPEVGEASAVGRSHDCRYSKDRDLLVCHVALKVGAYTIYVQESSRRAIGSLYAVRYPLTKLTLMVFVFGAALAWWTGRRLVGPVEKLRDELLRRAQQAVPTAAIQVVAQDEIADLTNAFNTLLAALAARTATNEAFLSDLAHEFKNPVASVRACADSLAESTALTPERAQQLARILHDSSVRLDVLVTELLDLARAEAGLKADSRHPIDLSALLRGLVDSLRADQRYSGVRFDVQASEPALIDGVASHLETALRNLLDNAASFAGPTGTVQSRIERRDDTLMLSVEDNGPGIAAEHLPRVFERFFTTRGKRRGTGLGLAIVRAVVEAHGGSVSVNSQHGQGAVFVMQFPIRTGRSTFH